MEAGWKRRKGPTRLDHAKRVLKNEGTLKSAINIVDVYVYKIFCCRVIIINCDANVT